MVLQALVGREVKVLSANNPLHCLIVGTIEDETHNALLIRSGEKALTVPKNGSSFLVKIGEWRRLEGSELAGKPHGRSKKR